jgi:hypothetical protein
MPRNYIHIELANGFWPIYDRAVCGVDDTE